MLDPYPELEFRDGDRIVPFHVAAMLEGIETWKYTYLEAVEVAQQQLLRDRLNKSQADTVAGHFREWG